MWPGCRVYAPLGRLGDHPHFSPHHQPLGRLGDHRYEEDGLDGLIDKRLAQDSHRRAPVDEVMRLVDRYRNRRQGWNVKHYTAWYKREGGSRSTTWVKNTHQQAGVANTAPKRGVHCKQRERAPWPGMMLYQDGRQHQWVTGPYWDLIVTMVVPEPAEGMTRPTSTTQCSSMIRKAHRAACVVYAR